MDPRLVKGLATLAALVLYIGAQWLPEGFRSQARETAAMLFGWQVLRRHNDLEPLPEGHQ